MPELILGTMKVDLDELPEAVASLQGKVGIELALLEWWNSPTELINFDTEAVRQIQSKPADLISGSIFGPSAELRWRKVNGKFWISLVAAEVAFHNLGGDWKWLDARKNLTPAWNGREPAERQVNLWGSQFSRQIGDSSEWLELRIPRPAISYPVKPDGSSKLDLVRLKLLEYRAQDGSIMLVRRYGLWAARSGNDKKGD